MKGLEFSRQFFKEYGLPMLRKFPEALPYISAGFLGEGSECLGYDDEVSTDHDFSAGFTVFLPSESEISRKTAFQMEREYNRLPQEYMGLKRPNLSPVGGNRFGIVRLPEFLLGKLGTEDGTLTAEEWLRLPEQYLLEVTNGELFYDGDGYFTELREALSFFPEEIFLKRLAGNLLLLGQAGDYNYQRCIAHGETGAAQLAVQEFVNAAMRCVFLLSGKYMPYYKWQFRALRELPLCQAGGAFEGFSGIFETLLTTPNDALNLPGKEGMIQEVTRGICHEVFSGGLVTEEESQDTGRTAYAVNDRIKDGNIRNLHILYCV